MPVAGGSSAKRYAEAIFKIAESHGTFDRWLLDLEGLSEIQQSEELARLLASPALDLPAKELVLSRAAPDLSPEARNLAKILLHKRRFRMVPRVESQYRQLLNAHRGIATAEVTTAVPLSAAEARAVADRLSEMTGRKVVIQPSVDPSIIGGIVARVGDELIDASVRGRLEALKRRLVTV